jgi:hypothetical protein
MKMGNYQHQNGLLKAMVLIVLATGVSWLWAVAAPAAEAGPKVSVPEIAHDFGKVVEDQAMSHTFVIKNSGGQPLKIEDVDPDCACTAAEYDRSIAPGGEGKITLTLKPFSVMHQFSKDTKVRFNDPDHPLVVFTVKGWAQPFIEIQPSHIVRLRGAPGDDLQAQIRFTSHLSIPFKITDVRNNIPDKIDVSLKAEEADNAYVLTVKNKCREPGAYGGLVELFTNAKQRPRLIVRVFGELNLPSAGGK